VSGIVIKKPTNSVVGLNLINFTGLLQGDIALSKKKKAQNQDVVEVKTNNRFIGFANSAIKLLTASKQF